MEVPSTPPRRGRHAVSRAPPAPLHGAAYNDMHPMTRRSPRSPAASVCASDALTTPAASPLPPTQPQSRRENGDNTSSSTAMLPTPLETPSKSSAHKRQRAASMQQSARILRFQPENPNDVMPSPRETRRMKATSINNMHDSGLDMGSTKKKAKNEVAIYTEPSARVPEEDPTSDNVFFAASPTRSPPRGRTPTVTTDAERIAQWNASPSPPRPKKTREQILEDDRLQAAVDRGEGVFYNFRGKKVFRKFEGEDFTADPGASSRAQRQLKRAAGHSASRPFTRSDIQPRLLWKPQTVARSPASQTSYSDEEAETDVDIPNDRADVLDSQQHDSGVSFTTPAANATPVKKAKSSHKPMMSPPTTSRTTRQTQHRNVPSFEDTLEDDEEVAADSVLPTPQRSSRKKQIFTKDLLVDADNTLEQLDHLTPALRRSKRGPLQLTPIAENSEESTPAGPPSPAQLAKEKKRKNGSPFDQWPRTKAGAKRGSAAANASPDGAPAKRSRSDTRSNAGQA